MVHTRVLVTVFSFLMHWCVLPQERVIDDQAIVCDDLSSLQERKVHWLQSMVLGLHEPNQHECPRLVTFHNVS